MKQEIKAIHEAMTQKDREFLARYGGFWGAMQRGAYLERLPRSQGHGKKSRLTTIRHGGRTDLRTRMRLAERR